MKFLPLVCAGLWRSPLATALTFTCVAIAFLLFGMLQAVSAAFDRNVAGAYLDRLYVWSRVSLAEPLPIRYLETLEAMPDVAAVCHGTWMGTYYRDPKAVVYAAPIDPRRYFAFFPELILSPGAMQALSRTRDGAVVSVSVARRFGWKVGDRISLHSVYWTREDGSSDWPFEIVGIFGNRRADEGRGEFLFNYEYFDASRAFNKGTVGWYTVRVRDPHVTARVAAEIDRRFANSSDETNTQTEKASAESLITQFGDVSSLVTHITAAVFFTLLLLTGHNMAQSMHDRVPELGVLKALGYSDVKIFGLVFTESLLLYVAGGALGLVTAMALLPKLQSLIGFPTDPSRVVINGLLAMVILALLTGMSPAWCARGLPVAAALAGR